MTDNASPNERGKAPEYHAKDDGCGDGYTLCDLCGRTTRLERQGRYRVYADHQNARGESCTHVGAIQCRIPCVDPLKWRYA